MSEMHNECRKYAERIRHEIEQVYEGNALDEDRKPVDLWRWVSTQALDYSAIVDSGGQVDAVRLYVTLGGPSCWVDTEMHGGAVVCKWGIDEAYVCLNREICDELEDIVAEWMYHILKR